MTPEECARAVAGPILKFGRDWMISAPTFAVGAEAGFDGIELYFRGRGGVLGEVHTDVVVAAMGLLGREITTTSWNQGRRVMPAADAAALFARLCAEHGRASLPDDVDLAGLAHLARTVVDAAEVAGLPLFAGWRALPVPDDAAGAAAHELNVLRELRGGAHLVAVVAHGLSPLEATLASTGSGMATFLGHPEPHPEVTDAMRSAREAAEVTTDAIVAPAFAALAEPDRRRLVELVGAALGGPPHP